MIEYWHNLRPLPEDVKDEIQRLVVGYAIEDNLLKVDSVTFKLIFSINRRYLYRGDCTAPADENDYTVNRNYITKDGLSGFSITPDNWIVSVFSNNKSNNLLDILSRYIESGSKVVVIANSDWIDSRLIKSYINKLGFTPVATTINSVNSMMTTYGYDYMKTFMDTYGRHLMHVFLVKVSDAGWSNSVESFNSFEDAFNYTNNVGKENL